MLVQQAQQNPESKGWLNTSNRDKTALMDEVAAAEDVASRLVSRVGQNLAAIIRSEINPLELMMEGELLSEFYADLDGLKRSYDQLGAIVELFALKNPGAKVLEVGAGTGGATATVLNGFKAKGHHYAGSLLGHYTFTDLSLGFLEGAKSKFCSMVILYGLQEIRH